MTDTLAQIRRYIKNTRSDIPEGFQARVSEIVALVQMSRREDVVEAFSLAFNFGFAKGVRCTKQENKKRRLARS